MKKSQTDEQFRRGVEQFNARQFFEAHETWEEIWLSAPEPEKTFLQGIIQVAAACHHCRRRNAAGALSLLQAGMDKLSRFPADYRGLQLDVLRATAHRIAAALSAGLSPAPDELPRIELIEPD